MIPYGAREMLWFLPDWAAMLLISVIAAWGVCMAGLALAKAGRSPYWALVLFIPMTLLPALVALAFARWPRQEPPGEEPGQG